MTRLLLNISFILLGCFINAQSNDSSSLKREGPQRYGGHDNGQIIIEGNFPKGCKGDGLFLEFKSEYNKRGQLVREGSFKRGKLWSGEKYFYSKKGKLLRVKRYKDGKYIGEADPAH